jgi:antibiotic biosynthesis monooxygenase (ABM) superfamily enzyme
LGAAKVAPFYLKDNAMYIRCAFFEGRVKPGCDDAFAQFVKEKLVPLWTKFPGASEVRVLRQKDSDTAEPHYAMVLAIKYPSLAAIDEALKSDIRAQSREETKDLVKLFEGRIFHTVFEAAHDVSLL